MSFMKGWRTIGFNAIMLGAAILGQEVDPVMIDKYLTALAVVWAGGNAALRAVTNTPIGKKF